MVYYYRNFSDTSPLTYFAEELQLNTVHKCTETICIPQQIKDD